MTERIIHTILLGRSKSRFLQMVLCFCLLFQAASAQQQKGRTNPKHNRERGIDMLAALKEVVKKEYYDPHFHRIDLDERFKAAAERIKQMDENWQIFRVIAQVLLDFNDSHTRFFPPQSVNSVEYGFSLQMIGNGCYVINVKKGSDAEAKGLKVGDVVLQVGKVPPTRETLWKIMYLLYELNPQESLALALRNPDGGSREMVVNSQVRTIEESKKEREKLRAEKKLTPYKCREVKPDLITCKLYTFEVRKGEVDRMMKEIGQHKNLILDLRGNSGGYLETVTHLIGYFFDHDVKIGTQVGRNKTRELIAKNLGQKVFRGRLIVLIDSKAASGSEVFARVMQIERRGNIVGDVSAGAVMVSKFYSLASGRDLPAYDTFSVFGASVTTWDLIMSDGKRLEGVGVIPDAPVVPSGEALRERKDPVLSLAALIFGAELGPEKAGAFHFITKVPETDDSGTESNGQNDQQ